MDYSSFLVRQGMAQGDSVTDEVSPGTEAYRESLLQALSQGKRRQRGVLSFRTTPAQKGITHTNTHTHTPLSPLPSQEVLVIQA